MGRKMHKTAFMTGAATGIGRASAEKFLQEGYRLAFMDLAEEASESLVRQYGAERVLFIKGNVAKVDEINAAFERAASWLKRVDVVFANAGIHHSKSLLELCESDWDELMTVNLKGLVFTLKASLPHLIANGKGSIVLTASDQCFIGKENSCAYGMSKAAIGQLTKSCAADYSRHNVRINAVCPASIRTPLADGAMQAWADRDFGGDLDAAWKEEAKLYPMRRVGTAAEVAELVYFLASDSASFMTGSLHLIDGGLTAI